MVMKVQQCGSAVDKRNVQIITRLFFNTDCVKVLITARRVDEPADLCFLLFVSGLTYWRLNETELYHPLPDSFDSGAYLLLQEASMSLVSNNTWT